MPALVYVLCAIAVQAVFPGVPRALTIVVILGFNTTINLLGIEATARLNAFWLALSLGFITLFVILALTALNGDVGGSHLSWAPLLQPAAFAPSAISAALSVATHDLSRTEERRSGTSIPARSPESVAPGARDPCAGRSRARFASKIAARP
jgi:hypothetical protein